MKFIQSIKKFFSKNKKSPNSNEAVNPVKQNIIETPKTYSTNQIAPGADLHTVNYFLGKK